MFDSIIYKIFKVACVFLIVGRFTVVPSFVGDLLTEDICDMGTKEMIEYYGYIAEEHSVITDDGYNLTIFRCYSKSVSPDKVVVLHHGLISSSDDFCTNEPSQGLAYVMADDGYDVWMSNARGSFYSRRHITLDPDTDRQFWNFSWYEIATRDYPAIFDYVREETNQSKVYTVAHSQGTTCMMTLLSEKPEYNNYIYAMSLMAPVGYVKHTALIFQALEKFHNTLVVFSNTELLPRSALSKVSGTICGLGLGLGADTLCEVLIELIMGHSDERQNSTTLRNNMCHTPSGASFNQIVHYGSEIRYDYFGNYMRGCTVPSDFDLWKICVPTSLHYSTNDKLSSAKDVRKLISKLNNSLALTQVVTQRKFNHVDFVWAKDAAELVYSEIMSFLNNHK